LSYSRHAVNDRDLSTQVNYKMHMNIRRMMGEHKHRHKRSKKLLKVSLASRSTSFEYLVLNYRSRLCRMASRTT